MPLPELLQWLGHAGKTGTLELEHDKVVKRIVFRDGRVVSCSTQNPMEMLGHFLVSQGRITEDTLREALTRQQGTGRFLGETLTEMGALTRDELDRYLSAKAEETIFSLFDWDNAEFRFHDDEVPERIVFPVNLRVEDILFRGAQRFDEMRQIREVFPDSGTILRRTGTPPPEEIFRNRMASTVYDMVDGERSIADIVLGAHASDYLVMRFLFELRRHGLVEVCETPTEEPEPDFVHELEGPDLLLDEPVAKIAEPGEACAPAAVASATKTVVREAAPEEPETKASRLAALLEDAQARMARGDFDSAIDVLNECYKERPGDESLRKLMAEAEAAFVEKAYRHYLPGSKIPSLLKPVEELTDENLSPPEFFLLSRIDGTWDLQSIIMVAPLREVDALRTLKRMREKGLIELRDPD